MYCKQCGNEIPDLAVICVKCGVATGRPLAPRQDKTRSTYVLLGALAGFFGFPGVHNLYAGKTGRGITQLLVSICTCWILWLPMYIWTVVEVCSETQDADGNPLV